MLIVTPLSRHSASRRWRGWGADWFPHRRAVSFSSRNKDKCKWISWQAHLLCISLNLRHTEHLWALKVQNNEVILWLQYYASFILHIQEIWFEKNQCNVFYLLSLLIHALILHLITLWFVLICLFVFLSITNTIMFNCTYRLNSNWISVIAAAHLQYLNGPTGGPESHLWNHWNRH